jgi:hypothetical protein
MDKPIPSQELESGLKHTCAKPLITMKCKECATGSWWEESHLSLSGSIPDALTLILLEMYTFI